MGESRGDTDREKSEILVPEERFVYTRLRDIVHFLQEHS